MKYRLTRKWVLSCATTTLALGVMDTHAAHAADLTWTDGSGGSMSMSAPAEDTIPNGHLSIDGDCYLSTSSTRIGTASTPGTVNVDGAGRDFHIQGPMTMNNGTLNVTDGALVYAYSLTMTAGGTNTINVNGPGSVLHVSSGIFAGYGGNKTLHVTNGAQFRDFGGGNFAYYEGIYLDGAGTRMIDRNEEIVTTALEITHGAKMELARLDLVADETNPTHFIIADGSSLNARTIRVRAAFDSHNAAVAIIRGSNTLVNCTILDIDSTYGPATLSVVSGARIYANFLGIGGNSGTLNIGIDGNTKVINRYGELGGSGLYRLTAGAGLAAGSYTPLEYTSVYEHANITLHAVGGKFDPTTHQVHVSSAQTANAGDTVSIDLMTTQRVLFTDTGTGKRLGLGFLGSDVSKTLTVSAELVADPASSGLTSILASGDNGNFIDAWAVHPTAGYTQGDDAYMSIEVGTNYDVSDFKVWHYDGSVWTSYAPEDLSYDGLYVGFTVTGFSSYALSAGTSMVSSAVPEPATLSLLSIAAFGLLRRKHIA